MTIKFQHDVGNILDIVWKRHSCYIQSEVHATFNNEAEHTSFSSSDFSMTLDIITVNAFNLIIILHWILSVD